MGPAKTFVVYPQMDSARGAVALVAGVICDLDVSTRTAMVLILSRLHGAVGYRASVQCEGTQLLGPARTAQPSTP